MPPSDLIVPTATHLALAGDICTLTADMLPKYSAWLQQVARDFTRVYVLAGNHEYYGVSVSEGNRALEAICALDPKLLFMSCTRDNIGDVLVLGCTLWSHVHKHAEASVLRHLNDYRLIKPSGSYSASSAAAAVLLELSAEHDKHVGWLTDEIAAATRANRRVIVLTHHAPTFLGTSAPQFATPLWDVKNCAFATNLEHLFASFGCEGTLTPAALSIPAQAQTGGVSTAVEDRSSSAVAILGAASSASAPLAADLRLSVNSTVCAWISGHTHHNCSHVVHGTLIVSNQKGYELWGHPSEGGPPYRSDAVITV